MDYSAALLGENAHCRRVAAWAIELGRVRGIDARHLPVLERAALFHHYPSCLLRAAAENRLRLDLGIEEYQAALGEPLVDNVLRLFHGHSDAIIEPETARLAEIVELADQFDTQFEGSLWFREDAEVDPDERAIFDSLRCVQPSEVLNAARQLPVFPPMALKLLRLSGGNPTFSQLERLAASDPTLATELTRAANSSWYRRSGQTRSLLQDIAYIGIDATRNVLYAASLRPLFAPGCARQIWNHSLECAQIAEQIAILSGIADPKEAFLAGLLHDIGRLAYTLLPASYQERRARLEEHGCPCALIEQALSGLDHATAGSEILQVARLPADFVEAVRHHHDPGRSTAVLPAILYLAEFWTGCEEDLPSVVRLEYAMKKAGVSVSRMYGADLRTDGAVAALRFTA